MSAHPDNVGPNRCSRVSYEERIEHHGYTRSGFAPVSAKSVHRAIQKLGMDSIPTYREGPMRPKNSEIIPINQRQIIPEFGIT